MGCLRRCVGRCATMPVGAPLVTPGAGTAQGVRGVSCGGSRCVSVQSRRFVRGECGVASANRGIASVIRATQVSPLHCGVFIHGVAAGHPGGRVGRCATMSVGAPLVMPGAGTAQGVRGVSCGANAVLHRPIAALRQDTRATQVSPLRCGVLVHGVAAGHPGGTRGVPSLQRLWRPRCQPTCRNGQPDRFSCRSDSFSGQPSRSSCHGVSECAWFNGFWGR